MNKLLTMASLFALSVSVQAQEPATQLNLFEQVERQQAGQPAQGPRMVDPGGSGPRFTLIGTSRFGDTQRARLRSQSGEVITVNVDADGSATIPCYPGFRIADAGSRHLVMEHPGNEPCFASAADGVSCSGSHSARLQLTTAQPIERTPIERTPIERTIDPRTQGQLQGQPQAQNRRNNRATDTTNSAELNGEQIEEVVVSSANPNNPFAAALRAARDRGDPDAAVMRAEAERFRPRRVDPNNLPPGTRIIRTPFGDRVVIEE
jgi:hypothetical protein